MFELPVVITKEELQKNKEYGIIPILRDPMKEDKDGNIVGLIEFSRYRPITDDGYLSHNTYTELTIKVGGHAETPEIKTSAMMKYAFNDEQLNAVLYGEHVIINTIDGERFKILIKEEE